MFPAKFMTKKTIMVSNQVALYIHILAVSVEYQLSIKVPKAMAVANAINSTDMSLVEKSIFFRVSIMIKGAIFVHKSTAFFSFFHLIRC
jgi:hypothetical protein